jgi:hypothetical protein
MEHIPIASGPPLILPQFSLRSRREQPVRDVFNARQYEHWNTDAPGPTQNFPDMNKQAPLNDMNPINSRTVTRDYRQSQPFVAEGNQLGNNPYFQKFDVATDPRNVARELRAAVYEYNPPRDQEVSNRLLARNFENRFVPESEVKVSYEKAIDMYSGLKPKLNDMKATFR